MSQDNTDKNWSATLNQAQQQHGRNSSQTRHMARIRTMQALYQWNMAGQNIQAIEQQFMEEQEMDRVDVAYFHHLLHRIPGQRQHLDTALSLLLDRPLTQIDPVERAILWIGSYEVLYSQEVPRPVAINEAVELAKRFGADQSYRYINGILDRLGRSHPTDGDTTGTTIQD